MRFLADENLNGNILRGLLRRLPALDVIRIQDVGLLGADDPAILAWAAQHKCVLLTHDVATITKHAYERVRNSEPMPGIVEVIATAPIGRIIEDLVLLSQCSLECEYDGQVLYIPLP